MSLKQNDKKIKLLSILSICTGSALLISFIVQIYNIDIKYNHSISEILVQNSKIVSPKLYDLSIRSSKEDYIMASKTGTKYYYQNCSGLSRIKVENLTFFTSEEQAERAGYQLAKNCKKP